MKSAKEIKKIQEDAIRDGMEQKLIHMAKNRYTSYACPQSDCPVWLRKELIRKGFKVDKDNRNGFDGIVIEW